jgi:hypothetical protein
MLKPARVAFAALVLVCSNAATGAAFQDSGTWSVEQEPLVRIGWVADQPDTEFFDVVGTARLPDGAIAIADRGLPTVTVVEADGSVRFSVGISGDGPEGFADLEQVLVDDGGHIHAFDARHQRLTEWTDAGALVGTTTLSRAAQGRRLDAVGRFESGSWYGRAATRLAGTPVGGTARDTVKFFSLDADGVVGERIAEVPGMVATQVMVGGQAATRHTMFSPRALDARFGNCLLLMASDVPTIRVIRPDGEHLGEIRVPLSVRRTTESDRQAWISGTIEANEAPPEAAPIIEEMGRALVMADQWPLANRIVAGDAGFVWLERYEAPEGPSDQWVVIDGSGEVVAEPMLADGLHLQNVEEDRVIGTWSDELGRQEVRVHALRHDHSGPEGLLAECR